MTMSKRVGYLDYKKKFKSGNRLTRHKRVCKGRQLRRSLLLDEGGFNKKASLEEVGGGSWISDDDFGPIVLKQPDWAGTSVIVGGFDLDDTLENLEIQAGTLTINLTIVHTCLG